MFPSRSTVLSLRDPAGMGRWIAFFDATLIGRGGINVESIEVPLLETGSHERVYGGEGYSFPNFASKAPIQVSIYEDDQYSATNWIQNWKLKIYDPKTQIYGLPVDYLKDLTVFLLPVDSNTKPTGKITIEGLFPIETSGRSFNYHTIDGRIVLQASFSARAINFVKS